MLTDHESPNMLCSRHGGPRVKLSLLPDGFQDLPRQWIRNFAGSTGWLDTYKKKQSYEMERAGVLRSRYG